MFRIAYVYDGLFKVDRFILNDKCKVKQMAFAEVMVKQKLKNHIHIDNQLNIIPTNAFYI